MAAKKTQSKDELVTVMLPLTSEKQDDVFVGVNGMNFKIQRGEEVQVPVYVAEVLKNSEQMDILALQRRRKLTNKQA